MTRRDLGRFVLVGILATTSAFSAKASFAQIGKPIAGLPNLGQVSDVLFRGAQPDLPGFSALQQMGVAIVVNFRDEPTEISTERHEVESLGIKYVSIPWSGRSEPSNAQVVQFLDFVRANPQAKIFVHCQRGADRTGVMVAAYRIAMEHKTVAEAVSEMRQFHYDHFWLPQLERYVNSLPQLLLGNSQFAAYAPKTAPATTAVAAATAVVVAAPIASASLVP
jgi:protein tyrosine/serine phosphatase